MGDGSNTMRGCNRRPHMERAALLGVLAAYLTKDHCTVQEMSAQHLERGQIVTFYAPVAPLNCLTWFWFFVTAVIPFCYEQMTTVQYI